MKAEILAVGTELLLGDILNTNAQFLAQELANLGIEVYYQTVVGITTAFKGYDFSCLFQSGFDYYNRRLRADRG